MVQTVCTYCILPGEKKIILKKPNILNRIFFSVRVIAGETSWHDVKISFDDPLFHYYYTLNGPEKYFEAEGKDIFQGNVWAYSNSDIGLFIATTEILC